MLRVTGNSRKVTENLLKFGILIFVLVSFSGLLYSREREEVKQELTSDRNESVDKISKELSNPVSSIYIFPFEYDFDSDVGPYYGKRHTLTIEPVLPVNLGSDWKVIIRTVIPLIHQHGVTSDSSTQSGIGDIEQSYFFAPQKSEGVIWGVGPIINIPIGSDEFSTKKWALGPAALAVIQKESWTYGMLAEQMWSVGGEGKKDINMTMVQPFLAYHIKGGWTVSGNMGATYDWVDDEWSIPLEAGVSKVIKIGGLVPVSIGLSPRYYIKRTDYDPRWGIKLMIAVVL